MYCVLFCNISFSHVNCCALLCAQQDSAASYVVLFAVANDIFESNCDE